MAISINKKRIIAAFFLLAAFACTNAAQAAIIKPANNLGLVGYWNIDEGKGTTAYNHGSAASTANGTLTSSPTWGAGKLGQALTFGASNNYVSTGMAWPSSGSISEWVYPTTYADWISPSGWKTDPNVSGNGFVLIDNGGSGSPGRWRAVFRPNTAGAAEADVVALQNDTLNAWTHLTMTWSLSGTTYTIHLYVNGVDQGATTWVGTLGNGVSGFHFGNSGDYDDNYFLGKVDDVRVYSRVLTPGEVGVFYNRSAGTRYNSSAQSGANGSTLNQGLVARWTMDGADVTDKVYDRVGGFNGYFYGTATSSAKVQGRVGQALNFNGVSPYNYVDMGDVPSLRLTGSMTVAAWIKPSRLGGDAIVNGVFFNKSGAGGARAYSFYVTNTGGFVASIASTLSAQATRTSSTVLKINQWYFVVGVYDASRSAIDVYVNGVLDNGALTGSVTSAQVSNNGLPVAIGAREDSPSLSFAGKVDDVRVYNRPLAASEISQLYGEGGGKINASGATLQNGTTLGVSGGLVGYWPFDGSTIATTVQDRSGKGNNGYVLGAATSSMLVQGKLGQAMKFSTSVAQDIMVGTAPAALTFAYNQPFSISFWAKPASGVDGSTFSRMVSIVASPNKFEYFIIANNNTFVFQVGKNGVGDSTVTSSAFTPGVWYHLTAVYDGANLNFYINGASVGTAAYTFGALSSPDGMFSIGGGGSAASGFNGSLDDVRVYNRALSSAEAKSLYTLGR